MRWCGAASSPRRDVGDSPAPRECFPGQLVCCLFSLQAAAGSSTGQVPLAWHQLGTLQTQSSPFSWKLLRRATLGASEAVRCVGILLG